MSPELLLLTLFIIKHFVCDFLFQTTWMATNKGTYGHLGGLAHVGVHMFGTFFVLVSFIQTTLLFLGPGPFLAVIIIEAFIHYHTDWFKMWLNKKKNWKPHTSPEFWISLGIDQLIHYLNYVGIVWYLGAVWYIGL